MPARVLPPPFGMTEKDYVWLLTTNRCVRCHLVKPLAFDWNHCAKCCVECLDSIHKASVGLIELPFKIRDTRAREQESVREAILNAEEYLERVKGLGGARGCVGWESAVLYRIPRYAKVASGRGITPTDNSFKLLKSHIAKGILSI
jgi:hypothetical protein